ncbi:MAG: pyruvate kinase [Thermoanaerobaculia bacterium]|nr:pyruvate kinase [Thermoanaerobaculia bacterium]
MKRKTKIIATMGPACESLDGVRALVVAGIDVARLNFSHGDHESHRRFAQWVRAAAESEGRTVALLQDIQGPKIRTGRFPAGEINLVNGETVQLKSGRGMAAPGWVELDYPFLVEDIQENERILLADGQIRLRVVSAKGETLRALIEQGGALGDFKGVAFPDSDLRLPLLSEKDQLDLTFGRELDVDLVAASFVRGAEDIERVAEWVAPGTPIIAKIELRAGYERLDEILERCHGAMVARGDLGVQLPLQQIPRVQSDILQRTNASGRVSITATEMLESMTHAYRPTRAEVSDVATAVGAGSDAVMLSGETAVGEFPARAVEVMDLVCREVELDLESGSIDHLLTEEDPFPSAIAQAAVEAATALDIETIVAFTESGNTARLLSKYRPRARIVAFTPEERTRRRMSLYWGVEPMVMGRLSSTDEMIAAAGKRLLEMGICEAGEGVVMVAGVPPNESKSTNLMKIHRV